MHEFELGVWRAIFIHLLRILQSIDEKLLVELDRRYDYSYLVICYLTYLDEATSKYHHLDVTRFDGL
jgi:hypothetical protein